VRNLEIVGETAGRLPGFLLAAAPEFQLLQNQSLPWYPLTLPAWEGCL